MVNFSLGFGLMFGEFRCFVIFKVQDWDFEFELVKQVGFFFWFFGEFMRKGSGVGKISFQFRSNSYQGEYLFF